MFALRRIVHYPPEPQGGRWIDCGKWGRYGPLCSFAIAVALSACAAPPNVPVTVDTPPSQTAEAQTTEGQPSVQSVTPTTMVRGFPRSPFNDEVGRWLVRCLPDRTNALVSCFAATEPGDGQVRVTYYKLLDGTIIGPWMSAGPLHDCPGYSQTIRVGNNAPVLLRYPPDRDNDTLRVRLTRQLERAETVRTQSFHWPRCFPRSAETNVSGFAEAHRRLRQMLREAKVE